jgi:23S rRNA (uracil1939-C5)-methyltransferase
MSSPQSLVIQSLGHAGEGIAMAGDGSRIYVPHTLPGETVTAEIEGDRGRLLTVETPSADRIAPLCRHAGTCGGCALQHAAAVAYAQFKRGLVISALAARGLPSDSVGPLISLPPGTRRRTEFAARRSGQGVALGFTEYRSHSIVPIAECPVLRPDIVAALPALRALLEITLSRSGTADMHITASDSGFDVAIAGGVAALDGARRAALGTWLQRTPSVARLSIDDETIAARHEPRVSFGGHAVSLPVRGFLQATAAAETHMLAIVREALSSLKTSARVADLFAGLGAFTLPLAERYAVTAVEWNAAAIAALTKASRQPGLKSIDVLRRDLFREPLSARELKPFAAVVFDPPRAGAEAQATALAASQVPWVVSVSCNPATFARDARLLVDGGYTLQRITPIDQFLFSAHVELVAVLQR